jgi:hypothetical protein
MASAKWSGLAADVLLSECDDIPDSLAVELTLFLDRAARPAVPGGLATAAD